MMRQKMKNYIEALFQEFVGKERKEMAIEGNVKFFTLNKIRG